MRILTHKEPHKLSWKQDLLSTLTVCMWTIDVYLHIHMYICESRFYMPALTLLPAQWSSSRGSAHHPSTLAVKIQLSSSSPPPLPPPPTHQYGRCSCQRGSLFLSLALPSSRLSLPFLPSPPTRHPSPLHPNLCSGAGYIQPIPALWEQPKYTHTYIYRRIYTLYILKMCAEKPWEEAFYLTQTIRGSKSWSRQ